MKNASRVWIVSALLFLAMPASATEIQGFTLNKIEGVGDLEGQLHERLTDDYDVAYADCMLYLEGYVPTAAPAAACLQASDCLTKGSGAACSSLGGEAECVECVTDGQCADKGDGKVLCDLSTRTCVEEPVSGDCAGDEDCTDSVCVLWNGQFKCMECRTADDCAEGQICQNAAIDTFCADQPGGVCEGCTGICYYNDWEGWICGECYSDLDCVEAEGGPACDTATHTCVTLVPPGECTFDTDCGLNMSCVFWDGEYKCVACVEDADCTEVAPVCLATEDGTMCVACVDDADCAEGSCDTATHTCKTTTTTAGPKPEILIKFSVDASFYSGYDYGIKVGTSCTETGLDALDSQESDTCTTVVGRRELSSYTNIEHTLQLTDLIGEECNWGDSGTANIYFYVQDADKLFDPDVTLVEFAWDYDPPVPPQNVTVEPGEANLKVKWDDTSNNEEVEYKVYWSTASFDASTKDKAKTKSGITAQSYQIEGLDNGVTVFVAVTAVDEFDNESELSTLVEEIPVAVDDFWEYYQKAGGGEEGGFCFVATAAFGSYMEPSVQTLRHFRDRVLLATPWGRTLVDWYYIHGPKAAAFIRDSQALKAAARIVLLPAVAVAWLTVEADASVRFALATLLLAGIMLWWRRRITVSGRVS